MMNDPGKNNVPFELITRYLAGEADEREVRDLMKWISHSDTNERIFNQYRQVWNASANAGTAEVFDIDLDEEWDLFTQRSGLKKVRTFELMPALLKLAAVLLIGLFLAFTGYWAFNKITYVKVIAGNTGREILLPDSSVVALRQSSILQYKRHFSRSERRLKLTGEAFFDVEKDSLRPFIISAPGVNVEVLGTSFNLQANSGTDEVVLVVEKGIVALETQSGDKREIVREGQKATCSLKENSIIKDVPDSNYKSWLTKKMSFEDSTLGEVVSVIENVYGVSIRLLDPGLEKCHISVVFENESLEYVLNTLSLTLDLKISRDPGRNILIDGPGC